MKCFFKTHPFQIGSYNEKEFVVFISLVGTERPLRWWHLIDQVLKFHSNYSLLTITTPKHCKGFSKSSYASALCVRQTPLWEYNCPFLSSAWAPQSWISPEFLPLYSIVGYNTWIYMELTWMKVGPQKHSSSEGVKFKIILKLEKDLILPLALSDRQAELSKRLEKGLELNLSESNWT